ncbi:MAG: hypothetical protein HOD92_17040, partial [Deltaproteobacteria bacterium]|nr:hypothetical protein [Deltaproteobacteria bacterium]
MKQFIQQALGKLVGVGGLIILMLLPMNLWAQGTAQEWLETIDRNL